MAAAVGPAREGQRCRAAARCRRRPLSWTACSVWRTGTQVAGRQAAWSSRRRQQPAATGQCLRLAGRMPRQPGALGLVASGLGGASPTDALATAEGWLATAQLACHPEDAAAALIAAARSLTAQAGASLRDGRWAAAAGRRGSSLVGGRRDSDLMRRGRQALSKQQLAAAISSRGSWMEEGEEEDGDGGSNSKHA